MQTRLLPACEIVQNSDLQESPRHSVLISFAKTANAPTWTSCDFNGPFFIFLYRTQLFIALFCVIVSRSWFFYFKPWLLGGCQRYQQCWKLLWRRNSKSNFASWQLCRIKIPHRRGACLQRICNIFCDCSKWWYVFLLWASGFYAFLSPFLYWD